MKDIGLMSPKHDWILSLVSGILCLFVLFGLSTSMKENWQLFLTITFVSLVNFYNCYRQYKRSSKKNK